MKESLDKAYAEGKPIVPDEVYDHMYPQGSDEVAPTVKVGKHRNTVKGLKKFYHLDEVMKLLRGDTYVVTPKIDGISCTLQYERGRVVAALFKGDRETGRDVLDAVQHIVPVNSGYDITKDVRGELAVPKEFEQDMRELGYANLRSAAVSLSQSAEYDLVRKYLRFIPFRKSTSEHPYLPIYPTWFVIKSNVTSVADFDRYFYKMQQCEFQCDGLVIYTASKLFSANDVSSYAFAIKRKAQTVPTVIQDVVWQTGRTGVVTPVAKFKAVELDGKEVTSATLHNIRTFRGWRITQGSAIDVGMGGDIVPQVYGVDRNPDSKPFTAPTKCPACYSNLTYKGAELLCIDPSCSAKVEMKLQRQCARDALYIKGVGEHMCQHMANTHLVYNLSQLIDWSYNKEPNGKTENNLQSEIGKALHKPALKDVITALCINGVASGKAVKLAQHFKNWEDFLTASHDQLLECEGVAQGTADAIYDALISEEVDDIATAFDAHGIEVQDHPTESRISDHPLSGKMICITGALPVPRHKIEKQLDKIGATLLKSVTSECDILYGDVATNSKKIKIAQKYGIEVQPLKKLRELLAYLWDEH